MFTLTQLLFSTILMLSINMSEILYIVRKQFLFKVNIITAYTVAEMLFKCFLIEIFATPNVVFIVKGVF